MLYYDLPLRKHWCMLPLKCLPDVQHNIILEFDKANCSIVTLVPLPEGLSTEILYHDPNHNLKMSYILVDHRLKYIYIKLKQCDYGHYSCK